MPIPDSVLNQWSHHHAATASVQAHTAIRDALAHRDIPAHDIFLQGSHAAAYERWQSFRRLVFAALRENFGDAVVTTGRKSLKVAQGPIPATADVVVTLKCGNGTALYVPDEHRWAVSFPQQHYSEGVSKERGSAGRCKRTTRMFKAARNHLRKSNTIAEDTAPSYFVECLMYNVPKPCSKVALLRRMWEPSIGFRRPRSLISSVRINSSTSLAVQRTSGPLIKPKLPSGPWQTYAMVPKSRQDLGRVLAPQ